MFLRRIQHGEYKSFSGLTAVAIAVPWATRRVVQFRLSWVLRGALVPPLLHGAPPAGALPRSEAVAMSQPEQVPAAVPWWPGRQDAGELSRLAGDGSPVVVPIRPNCAAPSRD